ncbi:sigma-70 family RNA polymerase sigma factor [Janthinobacterium sp. SUN118]|nr:sigma-70 family RNA polymerase sigma factor [Janthinobacterium sp. SUN118]MDN2709964.1 sigma-70 family RNA polymerase sigma factor [Janthinobacterium sp. SUN118]
MNIAHSSDTIACMYSNHHGWLMRWLRAKLQCADHAADLAQDTFVRLLAAPPEGRQSLHEPRAYLTTVAQRLLIDHYRRLSLEQAWLETLAQQPELLMQSPEERLLVREALQRIDAMLDGLPPLVRSAFLLAHVDGLGYAEIGLRLGVSERSIKRYMVQAFERCILLIL